MIIFKKNQAMRKHHHWLFNLKYFVNKYGIEVELLYREGFYYIWVALLQLEMYGEKGLFVNKVIMNKEIKVYETKQ